VTGTITTIASEEPPDADAGRRFRVTRRGLQIALGVVWLLDGALQLQPLMFGSGFAGDILSPAGDGQPGWVAAGVHWAAGLVGSSPALWNGLFAAVQLAIGIGLLIRPLARIALLGSVGWGLAVWYLGEGAGGVASGHGSLLTGAPGAVLLYVVLAAIAWPVRDPDSPQPAGWRGRLRQDGSAPPAAWTPVVWAVVWIGGAVLQALPGQNTEGDVSDSLTGMDMPNWLMSPVTSIADGFTRLGAASMWLLLAVLVAVGVGGLLGGRTRTIAGWAGLVLGVLFWVFGQGMGDLFSGQATDPNSGPLLALLGVALLGTATDTVAATETGAATVASDSRRSVLASVAAVAVVGVGLLLWVNTRPAPLGPPPSLTLTSAYTPVGNSATAPVYFTITNKGDGPDTLMSAGTEFQTATMTKGVTVCANQACTGDNTVTVPAHGTLVFGPTGPHLLVNGLGALTTGHQPLQLTLTFARSGVLHVLSPIGTATNLTENDIMTYGFMGGSNPGMDMSGMPGMPGMSAVPPTTDMPGMSTTPGH
jgi:copper(I)-binding protein